eukprot:m.72916 g.72916  ORF g.72916 m.72916 type:complete len:194 (-) comp8017_c0_seq1:2857-3438(-)
MADHRIAKPQTDDRSYRVITLPNGLRAVLISDPAVVRQTAAARRASAQARRSRRPKTEPAHPAPTPLKAAASLCLEIGSFSDPPELQGLCHFLEHMMFMGSEKYPEENDFDRFLKQHGGKANAHTENELVGCGPGYHLRLSLIFLCRRVPPPPCLPQSSCFDCAQSLSPLRRHSTPSTCSGIASTARWIAFPT